MTSYELKPESFRQELLTMIRREADRYGEEIVESGTIIMYGTDGTLIVNAPLSRLKTQRCNDFEKGAEVALMLVTHPSTSDVKPAFPEGLFFVKAYLPCSERSNGFIQLVEPNGRVVDEGPGSVIVAEQPSSTAIDVSFEGSSSKEGGCWCTDGRWLVVVSDLTVGGSWKRCKCIYVL